LRIGIFGGTFDPLHFGHLNSIQTVCEELHLDQLRVIPANQSPHRPATEGPNPKQRLEMVRRGIDGLNPKIVLDDLEVTRGGVSFTIDTVKALSKTLKGHQLVLIIGIDQFENFEKWKNFEDLLSKVDLLVTSRPGTPLPATVSDYPSGIQALVKKADKTGALLKTGHRLQFLQLRDVEVSATEIRRRFRAKESIKDLIPEAVEKYIRSQGLYESLGARIGDFEKLTRFCTQALRSKSGVNIQAYDLRALQHPSEFTIVASGTSSRQAQSLAETLMKAVKDQYGVWPQSVEGLKEGRWVVVDYGSLIVHVFYDYVRNEYRLEELWREANEMRLEEMEAPKLSLN
jgi:nicotinate-nucleotide adenylyltransferase